MDGSELKQCRKHDHERDTSEYLNRPKSKEPFKSDCDHHHEEGGPGVDGTGVFGIREGFDLPSELRPQQITNRAEGESTGVQSGTERGCQRGCYKQCDEQDHIIEQMGEIESDAPPGEQVEGIGRPRCAV